MYQEGIKCWISIIIFLVSITFSVVLILFYSMNLNLAKLGTGSYDHPNKHGFYPQPLYIQQELGDLNLYTLYIVGLSFMFGFAWLINFMIDSIKYAIALKTINLLFKNR